MKQWYESLFENYGRQYDEESFVQGTASEYDFIEGDFEMLVIAEKHGN